MMKNQIVIDPRTASEEDFETCFRYIRNAECVSGGTKVVNGRPYTLLQVRWSDSQGDHMRFALGHPAIKYSTRIKTVFTFEYYTGILSILDEESGVMYNRLALDPTEEEMDAYRERLARAEARAKAFEARQAEPRPKAHGIKYFD